MGKLIHIANVITIKHSILPGSHVRVPAQNRHRLHVRHNRIHRQHSVRRGQVAHPGTAADCRPDQVQVDVRLDGDGGARGGLRCPVQGFAA